MKLDFYKRYLLILLLSIPISLGIIPSPVHAADEKALYGVVESFIWREFADNGQRLVKETGPLIGIGFYIISEQENQFAIKVKGEIFGGQVDYDGHTQAGVPAFTDTNYFGFKGEIDFGKRIMLAESTFLEPFLGGGYRWWIRDIENGRDIFGNPVSGLEEIWTSFYVRLGLRGNHNVTDRTYLFAEAGLKLPIYNLNETDLVDLEPGIKSSIFAEVGVRANRVKIAAFYDSMRFSKSDIEIAGPFLVWQPESEADIYGIQIGMLF